MYIYIYIFLFTHISHTAACLLVSLLSRPRLDNDQEPGLHVGFELPLLSVFRFMPSEFRIV